MLRNGRNSALHLAYADVGMTVSSIGAMARVLRLLLGGPQATAGWLSISEPMEALLAALPLVDLSPEDVRSKELMAVLAKRDLHVLIGEWAAARRWDALWSRIPPEQLLAMTTASAPSGGDDGYLGLCPTGGHLAWFYDDYEEDEDSEYDETSRYMRHFLDRVDCPLCGLRLQSPEELDYHGLERDFGVEEWVREEP
ncbi:hypothetical protein LL946_10830 [Knoellia locipacati]|uniref:hypothetical protein n=1 Tax=Knoellia locipacati TaxID=882824 RepID=UPI00384CB6DA